MPGLMTCFYVLLGIWAIVYGLMSVTNLEIVWMKPISGFAALLLGIICFALIIRGEKKA